MASSKKTVHILLLNESDNDAEAMVNLLRNAGHATRAQQVSSIADLTKALDESTWDLFLARPKAGELSASLILKRLKKLDKDIPVILISNENNSDITLEALKQGAKDVVPKGENERLSLVINRELNNLDDRRGRRVAEIHLNEAEKRCQLLLSNSVTAISYVVDGMHIYANDTYAEIFGYADSDDLAGMTLMDLVNTDDHAELKSFLKKHSKDDDSTDEISFTAVKNDGATFAAHMTFSSAVYDDEPCTQITLRTEAVSTELEGQIKEISSQDVVTGLFNRHHFMDSLDSAVEKAVAGQEDGALLYIHLDKLTSIKSDIGIADTDLLLADLANFLTAQAPKTAVLSRFGDDVFAAILPSTNADDAVSIAEKLRSSLKEHMADVDGRTVQVTSSTGIALLNDSSPVSQELVTRAHKAADQAATTGNKVELFHVDIAQAGAGDIANKIHDALNNDRFRLLFQPIISLRGDSGEHYEVLLRMLDKDDSELAPETFMPAAHETGLATKLDRWVILEAIKLLTVHRSKGHDARMFVNLTAASIQDASLPAWIGVAIKAANIPSNAVIFQVTEADATSYLKQAKTFIEGVQQQQCKTALCHFGCSLNPFNTLKHVNVDYVKVDGSFTHDMQNSKDAADKLKELAGELHNQGKMSIVPLVENATVLATLWQAGVNYIQGYYLQGPSSSMDYDFTSEDE